MQLTQAARHIATTLVCLAGTLLAGCATVDTSDLDVQRVTAPGADLASYRSFRWAQLPSDFDKEVLALIVPAIEKELEARGLTRQHEAADLLLILDAGRRTRLELAEWETTSGSSTTREDLALVEVAVGNVGLEMLDASTDRPVWRGQVFGVFREELETEQRTARALAAAAMLLGDFPDS